MEVSFTQNGNAPNTPYQAAPANALSLIEKVTGLAPPSSSLLDFILLRTKNNGALEERGKTGEAAESIGNALVRKGLAHLSHQEPAGAAGAEAGGEPTIAGNREWSGGRGRALGVGVAASSS